MVNTSMNALEHAKKLELLNSAGYIFNSDRYHSVAEKFHAAAASLDLGFDNLSPTPRYLGRRF